MHTRQVYDANDQLTGQQWTVGDTTYSQVFTYSKTTGVLSSMTPGNGHTLSLNYDALQRLSSVTGGIYEKSYTYRDISATQTTTQVSELTYDLPTDIVYGYTYDAFGNIATYSENGTTYAYTYSDDSLHQLLSQTGGGKAYTYTYDGAGNILTASDGNTTHTYKYGYDDLDGDGTEENLWKDLLIRFDGESILYDDIGNPTSYYNGTRWTMDWREGRRLVTANGGGKVLSFTYDSDGLRLTKKVGSTTYHYSYAGGKLMRQTGGGNTLDFFYDESGHPYALKYNGTTYYYVTNLQGDVLHIVDASGAAVVSYTYDPYGKPLTTDDTSGVSLGTVNPLRYRGYVYDSETGFYYLQSRYYDPEIGRFINADSYVSTGQGFLGHNMFAYCNNNPANSIDSEGTLRRAIFGDNHLFNPNMLFDFGGGGSSYPNGGVSTRGKSITLKEFLDTDDPEVVFEHLETYGISYYKGVLVVETSFDASFSYGFIGLSASQKNADTLKHEYGHTVQLKNMGIGSYIADVAIPSVTINILSRLDKLPYDYYTYPFEAEANKLGGSALSDSRRSPLPEGEYTSYWDLIPLFFK